MAKFDQAAAFVLANEGKALNDHATGEYSRCGITLALAVALKLCAPGEQSFIDQMTPARATEIYFDAFWRPLKLDAVFFASIGAKILDMAVNMGAPEAVTLAQRACNGLGATLSPDGAMGYMTLTALNKCEEFQLLTELRAESIAFYRKLVDKNPAKYAKYWDGWKERAEK
jgi:lysozyme family protein